jgi:hypothetical protein
MIEGPSMYSPARFNELIDETIETIRKLSTLKGGEYAGDADRLENFRRNATKLGLPMETVWNIYVSKHIDAIDQYVRDVQTGTTRQRLESISGRADDIIVYMILFKAMVEESEATRAFVDLQESWDGDTETLVESI